MMTSENFLLIENLYNAAVDHKKHCEESICGVSVALLRKTAEKLWKVQVMVGISQREFELVTKMFKDWPL